MIRLLSFPIFLLFFNCWAQAQIYTSDIYRKYKKESCQRIDTHWGATKDSFFIDYIIKKINDSTYFRYLEDRRTLYKVEKVVMSADFVEFIDSCEYYKINFTAGKENINIGQLKNIKFSKENGVRYIDEINQKKVYGLSVRKKKLTRIKKTCLYVDGNQVMLPDSLFEGLFFPNFNQEFYNIKPIEIYYSQKNDCFYLYIFGFDRLSHDVGRDMRKINTYFSKIVFDKKRVIYQITISWGELFGYNMDCGHFIGF